MERRRAVAIAAATVAIAVISFGVWVHHMYAVGLPVLVLAFFAAQFMGTWPFLRFRVLDRRLWETGGLSLVATMWFLVLALAVGWALVWSVGRALQRQPGLTRGAGQLLAAAMVAVVFNWSIAACCSERSIVRRTSLLPLKSSVSPRTTANASGKAPLWSPNKARSKPGSPRSEPKRWASALSIGYSRRISPLESRL